MHRHILIEAVTPCVDGGRYAAKGIVGEPCIVEADIFRDGHSLLRAVVKWQKKGDTRFSEAPMVPLGNDRFRGEFPLDETGLYVFAIEAWTDQFASWQADFTNRATAGNDIALDLREGVLLMQEAAERATGFDRGLLAETIARLSGPITDSEALELLAKQALNDIMMTLDQREDAVTSELPIKIFAHRAAARFSTWYELFARSEGSDPQRGATLREAEQRLPKLRAMG